MSRRQGSPGGPVPSAVMRGMVRTRVSALAPALAWVCLGFLSPGLRAAVPVLDHVFPAAMQVGTTQSVTLVGKFDPWPVKVDLDIPGVGWEATTNSGVITIRVAASAPVGAYAIRAVSPEGASAPRFLILSPNPQRAEVEPNDSAAMAQPLTGLPAEVNGRLEKNGDVDSYAIDLRAGQTLVARLEAYTLQSPLDPVLRLLDARGVQVAWNHDEVRSLDPLLVHRVESTGPHVLQLFGFAYPADSDLRFSGSPKGVYRLHATTDPVPRHAWPLGIRRSVDTKVGWADWGPGPISAETVAIPAVSIRAGDEIHAVLPPGRRDRIEVPVGEGPEGVESEPNDTAASAARLEIPSAVSGDLDRAGDEDRYRVAARKGEALRLEIRASALGFPLDAWLRIEDAAGKELARNDDAGGADPVLDWTPPETAEVILVVGNLLQRGGRDQRYRLSVARPRPAWSATVPEASVVLTPGLTNDWKVAIERRHGSAERLRVSVAGIPAGVRVDPVEVPEKATEAILRWVAATNAPAFSGPFHVEVAAPDRVEQARFPLVSAGENNGVPQGFRRLVLESVRRLWITVAVPPAPAPAATAKK